MTCRQIFAVLLLAMAGLEGCRSKPREPEDPLSSSFYRFRMDAGLFSASGHLVLFADKWSDVPNAFVYDISTGKSMPVTKSKTPTYPISFLPRQEGVMYRAQPEKDSVDHLYVQVSGQAATDLTPWQGIQAAFYEWASDRRTFYFGSNKNDRRYMQVFRMDLQDNTAVSMLATQDMRFATASPDGRYFALWNRVSAAKSAAWVYDFGTKNLDKIAPQGDGGIAIPQFFDAHDFLYYLTNSNSSTLSLVKYDFATKIQTTVYAPSQTLVYARISANQHYVVAGIHDGVSVTSRLLDLSAEPWKEVPLPKPGQILDISPDGKLVLYDADSENNSKGLQIYNLETKEVRKIQS